MPADRTLPSSACSTSPSATPSPAASSFTTCAARSGAFSAARLPWSEPRGLRPAATITVVTVCPSPSEDHPAGLLLPLYLQGQAQVRCLRQQQHATECPGGTHL